jgi:hypothetical protein
VSGIAGTLNVQASLSATIAENETIVGSFGILSQPIIIIF